MDEQKYLKGFNDGYFTAKHMPDLRQSMTFKNVSGPTDYQLGYKDGEKEFAREFQERGKGIEKEKEAVKNFSINKLRERYSKDHDIQEKDQTKDIEKD